MNKRDQERRGAKAALGKIAQKTGINPQAKVFPECPCGNLNKAQQIIKQLIQENKLLKKNIREFVDYHQEKEANREAGTD